MGMLLSVPMALIGAGGILMAVRGYTRPAKAVEAA
jgi:phosphatidylglycerol:prolipoprotein diacylglycerol transferase